MRRLARARRPDEARGPRGADPGDARVPLPACARTPRRLRQRHAGRVPAGIGIDIHDPAVKQFKRQDGSIGYGGIDPPCAEPCISPLHTHDVDGILHTEAKKNQFNTLGEFFTEWDVRLDRKCVGGYCKPAAADHDLRRRRLPTRGDPREIELEDKREIAIVIGSPPQTIPSELRVRLSSALVATIETNTELGRQVVADAKQYVLHSWSVQDALDPIPVAGGEGRYFWDYDGKRYLDFASQLVNVSIGHQHPKIVAAIKEQAEKLCTIGPPMATEARSTLARLLAEVTPGDLQMSFFTNGGAEANENAIKLARWYTGRHKIIARYRSYHGATAGAITLTGDPRRWPAEPGIPGVVRMLDPYTYRCPAGHPDPCPVCTGAPHLEEILQYEGAHTVAAVILETVVGTNGIIVPPDGYLQSIREVCDRHGILLIADEVMAGFGRTGKWFGVENWDVVPDILTVAKGINSGYVPLGAMIVRKPIADWVRDKYFAGGLTYSGHPLACASAVASIEAFKEEGIVENSAEMGGVFAREAARTAGQAPVDRRGARARLLLGHRARQEPRDARAARPVQRHRARRSRRSRASPRRPSTAGST